MDRKPSFNAPLIQKPSIDGVNFNLSLSWWSTCFRFMGMVPGNRPRTILFGLLSMWTLSGWLVKICELQHVPGWLEISNSYASEIPNGLALCFANTLTYFFIVYYFRSGPGSFEARMEMFSSLECEGLIRRYQRRCLFAWLCGVMVFYGTVFGIAGNNVAKGTNSYWTAEPLWIVIADTIITMITFATNVAILVVVSGYFILTCSLHVLQVESYTSHLRANPQEPLKQSMDRFWVIKAQVDSTKWLVEWRSVQNNERREEERENLEGVGFSMWLTAYSCAMLVGWVCWVTSVIQYPTAGFSLWLRAGYNLLESAPLIGSLFAAASVSTAMQKLACNVPPKAVITESIFMVNHFTAQYNSKLLGFKVFGWVIEQDTLLKLCTLSGTVTVSYVQFLLNGMSGRK